MTAPDSRDSVELDGGWTSEDRLIQGLRNDGYDEAADLIESLQFRLQALARGPQRAGGGAAKWTPEEVARQLAERPNQPHYIAALVRKAIAHETAALQAEVARLRESLSGSRNVLDLLRSVVSAEGVSKFTHVESRSGSLVCVQSTINAIDAALNGGQDDA